MAMKVEEIQKQLQEAIGIPEIQGQNINEKGLKKEGTDDVGDFIESVVEDMKLNAFHETLAPDNFFPTRLDPTIYDNGTLYRKTPLLTYLEAKNKRLPSDTLEIKYLKQTVGFAGEWIDPANDTSGDGTPTIGTGTASICFVALPVSLSRIIGMGQSRASRPQVMNNAQLALREEINQTLITGDDTSGVEFDGLLTIGAASGNRTNLSGAAMTVEQLDAIAAIASTTLKNPSSFVLTNEFVLNQIRADMYPGVRNERVDVVAGVNPIAYSTGAGPIPFISDPNVTLTANQKRLQFLNEEHIFVEDFIDSAWVQKGTSKPFTEDGWMVAATVLYNTYPGGIAEAYGIA